VPADDIVSEDLEFRLLVHLRPRRQQDSLRLHRPIGLLRRLADEGQVVIGGKGEEAYV
jgi:hypothetical protein